MRRIFTFVLALSFAAGPLMAALPGSDESRLPACCRRLGAHHCAMAMRMLQQGADQGTSIHAPATCPNYPTATPAVVMPRHALIAVAAALPIRTTSIAAFATSAAHRANASDAVHAVRGPPVSHLA